MKYRGAIVFGFNEYAKQIALQIVGDYEKFAVFVKNESEYAAAKESGFSVEQFDLSENWKVMKLSLDNFATYSGKANSSFKQMPAFKFLGI